MTNITKIVVHTDDKPEPIIVHLDVIGTVGIFELLALKSVISVSNDGPGKFKWAVQNPDGFNHLSDVRSATSLWGLIEDVLDYTTVTDDGATLVVHSKSSADRNVEKRLASLAAANITLEQNRSESGYESGQFFWSANVNGYMMVSRGHSSQGSALNDAESFQKAMVNMVDNSLYKVRQTFMHLMERKGIVSNAAQHTVLAQLDEAAKAHLKVQP